MCTRMHEKHYRIKMARILFYGHRTYLHMRVDNSSSYQIFIRCHKTHFRIRYEIFSRDARLAKNLYGFYISRKLLFHIDIKL